MDEFASSEMAPSVPVEEESREVNSSSVSARFSQPQSKQKESINNAANRYVHYRSNISTI